MTSSFALRTSVSVVQGSPVPFSPSSVGKYFSLNGLGHHAQRFFELPNYSQRFSAMRNHHIRDTAADTCRKWFKH